LVNADELQNAVDNFVGMVNRMETELTKTPTALNLYCWLAAMATGSIYFIVHERLQQAKRQHTGMSYRGGPGRLWTPQQLRDLVEIGA
jgi:hypothetical protein